VELISALKEKTYVILLVAEKDDKFNTYSYFVEN
jgi:hypothetical protein